MNSISECLSQIVSITKKNLDILNIINESFYTKKEHLVTNIDGVNYVIPSFLSLENKIDLLRADLDNILNAPKTGEAYTYLDGTTQKIELSGFQVSPNSVNLESITSFNTKVNNIFKDFTDPKPYIKLDISSISNNIKNVVVKKFVLSDSIGNNLSTHLGTITYSEIVKLLDSYTDYTEYDTIYRLPLRSTVSSGTYYISSIINNYTDNNFDEFYELQLDRNLTYFTNNDTIERDFQIGDQLTTYNDKTLLTITSLNTTTNTITVKVNYGAYTDLTDVYSGNPELYTLKYYKSIDFDSTKYIEVPLEEDRYICVFVAPINDTTNIRAHFGRGLFIDTDNLKCNIDGVEYNFNDYYNDYVNNIGDSLYGITKILSSNELPSSLSQDEFNNLINTKPTFNNDLITVTQINNHLDDSDTVKNIRNLYNQKTTYKQQLTEINNKIYDIQQQLIDVSYDEANSIRINLQSQLNDLSTQKSQIETNIGNINSSISEYANSSDTPIENAKYRIRGFLEVSDSTKYKPIKIRVEYRYKNRNKFIGNAITIKDGYIFSDWNSMESTYRRRVAKYMKYEWEDLNNNVNEISFNQIDIPISQGETVDIRYKIIYNLGYPLVEVSSEWSEIYSVEFPSDLVQDVEILDIIDDNNTDIRNNYVNSILINNGYTKHKDDLIQDQDNIYFHQPEHIASGFYSDERRIIPLKDKLEEIVNSIYNLQSDVYGGTSDNLLVTVTDSNNRSMKLSQNNINTFTTTNYNDNTDKVTIGDKNIAHERIIITFSNIGSYNIKLHTMFPGNNQDVISKSNSTFSIDNYSSDDSKVYIQTDSTHNLVLDSSNRVVGLINRDTNSINRYTLDNNKNYTPQVYNQWLYFKIIDAELGSKLYDSSYNLIGLSNLPKYTQLDNHNNLTQLLGSVDLQTDLGVTEYSSLYPYIGSLTDITIDNNQTYTTVRPGESISIGLNWYYYVDSSNSKIGYTSKIVEFDVRTSTFRDPTTYKLIVKSYKDNTLGLTRNINTNTNRIYQVQIPNIIKSTKTLS